MPLPSSIIRSFLILPVITLPVHAAPADADLLKFVQERAKLERVTQKAVDMDGKAAAACASAVITPPTQTNPHHNASIHVYANEPAALPMFDPWGRFPEGSLVLKEKLGRANGETELFTGMWKREKGYFPETGDWEFFTVDAKGGKVLERGKLQSCAKCHQDYAKGDFVTRLYTAPAQLTGGRIVLHSSKALAHGTKLHYEDPEAKNTLGYWTDPADWAEWKFTVDRPGSYTIQIWQGCGKGSGGSEIEMTCAGQANKFIVEETGGFQNFKVREVGTIQFEKPGPQTFELRVKSKPGMAVMDCRQILLVPVR